MPRLAPAILLGIGQPLPCKNGRNPVNSPVDVVNIPIIYKVLYIPGGSPEFWTINSSPLKIGLLPQKDRIIFQPLIFRGHLSFREGKGLGWDSLTHLKIFQSSSWWWRANILGGGVVDPRKKNVEHLYIHTPEISIASARPWKWWLTNKQFLFCWVVR